MTTLLIILASAIIVYFCGLPLFNAIHEEKEINRRLEDRDD